VPIKIALPKGHLLDNTASLLKSAGWGLDGYHEKARLYHIKSEKFPAITAKMFHEKDIPIQVAVGNYDLGICGLDWIEELLVKYPSSALVKIKNLGYREGALYIAAGQSAGITSVAELKAKGEVIRIASEYPNLTEFFALKNRLSQFSIFPVWGGAEVYPPESAELALLRARKEVELYHHGMTPVGKVLDFTAFLVANRSSWESKNLDKVISSICDNCSKLPADEDESYAETAAMTEAVTLSARFTDGTVRVALPDGHQQTPVIQLLDRAGIGVDDYPSTTGNRRPAIKLAGVTAKVIRPQDMPLQVANGNFDLAISGKDWLMEHLYQFPSSPVQELLNLRFGKVRIVAVVSRSLPVTDAYSLRQLITERSAPFRVASEYVNIADKYARDNHLGHYRVVPTWGATEAFLPEDADLLIENTQTGKTIAEHNLKIIDSLFESTGCLIGRTDIEFNSRRGKIIKSIIDMLSATMESNQIESH
jgi:ATP phosphoribosyltransferase